MAGQEESRLTLREHLEELRKRLFVAALAVALGTVVAFVLHREILKLLMGPADDLLSGTDAGLIYTNLTENLGVSMKVSLLGGFILALPVVVYELVMFIAPGLTPRERRYLLMFLPAVVITFALGVLFVFLADDLKFRASEFNAAANSLDLAAEKTPGVLGEFVHDVRVPPHRTHFAVGVLEQGLHPHLAAVGGPDLEIQHLGPDVDLFARLHPR